MKRAQRLQVAREWIPKYTGKDIVRGYRRWFGVDKVSALIELKMCGLPITDDRIENVRNDRDRVAAERRQQRELRQSLPDIEQEDNFAYIIGYTSGGAPYGLTWDEWEQIEDDDIEE